MIFGAARGVLLVAIIVLLARLTPLPEDPWWHDSRLIVNFEKLSDWMLTLLPPDLAAQLSPEAVDQLVPVSTNSLVPEAIVPVTLPEGASVPDVHQNP